MSAEVLYDDGRPPVCSICVASYRRPESLRSLLESLDAMDDVSGIDIEVLVVDNDAEATARPVVEALRDAVSYRLEYLSEPAKNISLARNCAVSSAHGQYLAFIDDDEVACRQWLTALFDTLERAEADGVFGPVIPRIQGEAPAWFDETVWSVIDERHRIQPTGARTTGYWTANCLVKAELLTDSSGPFDPAFGLTGGEDTELFSRLVEEGAQFVSCAEAVVWEDWPADRASLSYCWRRGFYGGGTHTRRCLVRASHRRWRVAGREAVRAGGQLLIGGVALTVLSPFPRSRARWLARCGSAAGRLAAVMGWYDEAYA